MHALTTPTSGLGGGHAGGMHVKRDARSGNFDVKWSEEFDFQILEAEKLSFTWFDSESADCSR